MVVWYNDVGLISTCTGNCMVLITVPVLCYCQPYMLRSHSKKLLIPSMKVELWELRKLTLYSSNSCPSPHSDSSGWDMGKGVFVHWRMTGGSDKLNIPIVWLVGIVEW